MTTYADLSPEAPRYAGAVLAACYDPEVPWQRVVRADGSLAKGERQRRLLEQEGVPFVGERVDMDAVWMPPADSASRTCARRRLGGICSCEQCRPKMAMAVTACPAYR